MSRAEFSKAKQSCKVFESLYVAIDLHTFATSPEETSCGLLCAVLYKLYVVIPRESGVQAQTLQTISSLQRVKLLGRTAMIPIMRPSQFDPCQ